MGENTPLDSGFKQRIDEIIDRCGGKVRERIWGRKTLFWSMVAQALSFNASCACAVKTLLAAGRKCSASTAAFCKARARFPEELLDRVLDLTAELAASGPPPARRVLQIDGVSFTLADTPENRACYDTPSGQAQGCGFPVMSALAVREATTGAFLSIFPGNWKTHDFRLFIAAISFFQAGDVVVADRAFCAYAALAWLRLLGADMVCRLHQRRRLDLDKAARNAKGDWTLVWRKGRHGAKSPVDAARFESLPEELSVRIVKGAATSFRLFLSHRLVGGASPGIANFRRLLRAVANDRVDARPGRREPRAVKKRAKPYPLLTCNRHEYQEIPHKSRYGKTKKSA